jgi:hypothetical protein
MLRRGLRRYARRHEIPRHHLHAHVAWWMRSQRGADQDWYLIEVHRRGVYGHQPLFHTLAVEAIGALRCFSRLVGG